jgi:hypothetical protein
VIGDVVHNRMATSEIKETALPSAGAGPPNTDHRHPSIALEKEDPGSFDQHLGIARQANVPDAVISESWPGRL